MRAYGNNAEATFDDAAMRDGWEPISTGWPDFLCRRGDEVIAVEVKQGADKLHGNQPLALGWLHHAGVPTFVCWNGQLVAFPTGARTHPSANIEGLQRHLDRLSQRKTECGTVEVDIDRLFRRTQKLTKSVDRLSRWQYAEKTYIEQLEREAWDIHERIWAVLQRIDPIRDEALSEHTQETAA